MYFPFSKRTMHFPVIFRSTSIFISILFRTVLSASNSTPIDIDLPQATDPARDLQICVDASHYQGWIGRLDFGECWHALSRLEVLVRPHRDQSITFFSRLFPPYPLHNSWELPYGFVDGKCSCSINHIGAYIPRPIELL